MSDRRELESKIAHLEQQTTALMLRHALELKIAHLEWALAAIVLRCQEAESESTVILPARSLGVFSVLDVELTIGDDNAMTVHVKVTR